MGIDLTTVVARLAELSDAELRSTINATLTMPQTAPGLLAWIDAACDWELHRRTGVRYELQLPEAAIPPEEDAASIDTAVALRTLLAQGDRSPATLAMLDAVLNVLISGRLKHYPGHQINSSGAESRQGRATTFEG